MLSLYYYPGNASLLPHMMLREIGAEFELRLVDRGQNAQKNPDYLKLHPSGRIPVLITASWSCSRRPPSSFTLSTGSRIRALPPPSEPPSGPSSTSGSFTSRTRRRWSIAPGSIRTST